MHLLVTIRGHMDVVNRFVNDLMAQYLPFKYAKDKKPGALQLAVRPIRLYEIVFPEEHLNEVLAMVQPYDGTKMEKRLAYGLRKLLRLKALPKKPVPKSHRVYKRFCSVTGIGLKDDEKGEDGVQKL